MQTCPDMEPNRQVRGLCMSHLPAGSLEVTMFEKPSLFTRIAIGKGVGFLVGLVCFISMPYLWPESGWMIRWGVLLWYATMGAFIGVFGVFTWHPVLHLPMHWWVRAPIIGGWMNFVLVLFGYDDMQAMLTSTFGPDGLFVSPFWFVLEGALAGLLIGYFATRFGGEGPGTLENLGKPEST